MKIAIIHYHLNPGGVTNVIKHQLNALSGECKVLILTGEPVKHPFPVDTIRIPGLGYDTVSDKLPALEGIAEEVTKAIYKTFGGKCDVLHVHNPMLAKNKNLLRILKIFQKNGLNLFLQVHDFAEDGRPLAYYANEPYIPDCHYGVINSRDYNLLLKSGLKAKGLHLLPNTVDPLTSAAETSFKKNRILYPIRAIRRKNIGEIILLSILLNNSKIFTITLPPTSVSDMKSYTGWKKFAARHNINIEFEAGLRNEFEDLISSSESIVTTSITEGFGFSFLEPWTAKKLLWGRKLPEICKDFEKKGVRLEHLYHQLKVPVQWVDKNVLLDKWMTAFINNADKFNFPANTTQSMKSFKNLIGNGMVDFGFLDEAFQKQIIINALSSQNAKDVLLNINPHLSVLDHLPDRQHIISNNKKVVLQKFNNKIYKINLLDIYAKVMKNSVHHSIDKKTLASFFLNPENFSLLKWGDYAE